MAAEYAIMPDKAYFDLIVQLREHSQAFEAEYRYFGGQIAPLLKESKPVPVAMMVLWEKRVRSWLSAIEAYRSAAQFYAERGEVGLITYLDDLSAWARMMLPDAEDLGRV
jgi:hypothetical protein